jgi:hypothetical protein
MNAVIREQIIVDQRGAVVLVDARLHPGETVEVTVRSLDKPADMSFLSAARTVSIDAPEDYSVAFEDVPITQGDIDAGKLILRKRVGEA